MRSLPLLLFLVPCAALASPPDGAGVLRVMGASAADQLGSAGAVSALVELPRGTSAASLGLEEIAPGIARVRGAPSAIVGFADAHPALHLEASQPIKLLMDRAGSAVRSGVARVRRGATGEGALVGIVDTGLDPTHPDFKEMGKTRVRWLLDLSHAPVGLHPELEERFGVKDAAGKLVLGAVLSGADIDAGMPYQPKDEVGHGTHVTGIAAASTFTSYTGVAPKAGIIVARVTRSATDSIASDDLLRGAAFVFDRADAEKRPVVANFSLGADFGSHDGNMLWERALASYVGPAHPGRAIVAAAGNSGSIASSPVHQQTYVSRGARAAVPFFTGGTRSGAIQIWITERAGSDLRVGLSWSKGDLVDPIPDGEQRGKTVGGLQTGVIHGSKAKDSIVPEGSRGAIVVITGQVPKETFAVTFEGEGVADLYLQATSDAGQTSGFRDAVRQSTINLPATHPDIIGVGCTVSRTSWTSISLLNLGPSVPQLDAQGGRPLADGGSRDPEDGEVCWFSSAGPTLTGVPKPEIMAPGAVIVASMSAQAAPGGPASVFTNRRCPPINGAPDGRCLQVDDTHGVSIGTSMSAPMVTGAIALLFQRNPTLTQDTVKALLQAGAHRHRGPAPFMDQSGPGELDVLSSLEALDELGSPAGEPNADNSWITLSADFVPADASLPVTATIELRAADPGARASLFDLARLRADVRVGGRALTPEPVIARRGPGLFTYTALLPAGLGGQAVTFGASFDGAPIVAPVTIPIATDPWNALYAPSIAGGCAVTPSPWLDLAAPSLVLLSLVIAVRRRR